jgi:phenylacetic acid degradation operon negative regulatory protein
MLVADWLALLRADPGLPPVYMGPEWPASTSLAIYQRLRADLEDAARAEFAALNARVTAGQLH